MPEEPASISSKDSAFGLLQQQFREQYCEIFDDHLAPRSIIVIPSLTLDQQILSKIKGHFYYEERMLCMLMLLKMPATKLTFVTSVPISPIIVDYYLHFLPGITAHHAKQRLTMLSCYDAGNVALTDKVLRRPRLIKRIRNSIQGNPAHLVFFNVTESEKQLALQLDVPIYGCDPGLNWLGTKSGSRELFRQSGIPLPDGYENLTTEEDIVEALFRLKLQNQGLARAVIKMENGFSGDGNAVFSYKNAPADTRHLRSWLSENLSKNLKIVARKLPYTKFINKFIKTGGIVEEFIDGGKLVTSPSVQVRINPCGEIKIISTHDQVLGGESGQVYLGATFPADLNYAREIAALATRVAELLRDAGVLGRFGIDFMSVLTDGGWQHYALEINLRKGGTTHPFLMLQFLTNGTYDPEDGTFSVSDGSKRYYYATDNLQKERYKGMTPLDLIDIAMYHGLHYDHSREEGVMFHLISALSQFGKLGLVSIGRTPERALEYFERVVEVLDEESVRP